MLKHPIRIALVIFLFTVITQNPALRNRAEDAVGTLVLKMIGEERLGADAAEGAVSPAAGAAQERAHWAAADLEGGRVTTWDRCQPIEYAVNLQGAPQHAQADLDLALGELSRHTGLVFRNVGTTSEVPQKGRGKLLANGGRVPVLVAWSTPQESSLLRAEKAAVGVGSWARINGAREYRTGAVVVNREHVGGYEPGFGRRGHATLLTHEWLHVLGFDHVGSGDSIMNPSIGAGPGAMGTADIAGLEALYPRGGC